MVCLRNEQRSFCHFWDCLFSEDLLCEGHTVMKGGVAEHAWRPTHCCSSSKRQTAFNSRAVGWIWFFWPDCCVEEAMWEGKSSEKTSPCASIQGECLTSPRKKVLGWPKSLLWFFCKMIWKNLNENFGQPNNLSTTSLSNLKTTPLHGNLKHLWHWRKSLLILNAECEEQILMCKAKVVVSYATKRIKYLRINLP